MSLPEKLGFQICEFPPDSDPCECCNQTQVQLYFRRTDYFCMDGQYYCLPCIVKEDQDNQAYGEKLNSKEPLL